MAARKPKGACGVSNRLLDMAWRLDLPPAEKVTLAALADAANKEGKTWIAIRSRSRPAKLDLIRKTSLSERTIQRAIVQLEKHGHITRDERRGLGVIYTVHPQPKGCHGDGGSKCRTGVTVTGEGCHHGTLTLSVTHSVSTIPYKERDAASPKRKGGDYCLLDNKGQTPAASKEEHYLLDKEGEEALTGDRG